ncbi:MAG TPA: triose-phosphate isomerase [Deltaproteobacteria bacterium]|nr:triose-phosphate isomerase [Deltaproteobacteria bacterium]
MRKPLIAGNWKMFKTLDEAGAYAGDLARRISDVDSTEILVCPPFVYLQTLVKAFEGSPVKIGSQNVFWEDSGAFTGEISAPMLRSIGASYAIIGHSERRQFFGETDETVNKRLLAALRGGLTPIVCVGETLEQREAGKTFAVIEAQVKRGLSGIDTDRASSLVVAYEPVWAIGTGKTATPEIAQESHSFIRGLLKDLFGEETADLVRILYGGSVKGDNIDSLMARADIDGALVGGASLDAASFERIIRFKGQ